MSRKLEKMDKPQSWHFNRKLKGDLECSKCGSRDTYFRQKDQKRVCRTCGFNHLTRIKKYVPIERECICGSFSTYLRKKDNVLENYKMTNKEPQIKCPRCLAEHKIRKNVGMIECYCGYIFEVNEVDKNLKENKND
jgi:hypothetical protein